MKHLFFSYLTLVVLAAACTSTDKKSTALTAGSTKDSTTIQWNDPKDQNIGKINQGQVVEILWHFKNSGNKPLVFEDVRPGCGCTGAEGPKEPIAPGKEGVIKAKFDSKNYPGSQHKMVYVRANNTNKDAGTAEETLSFSVDVAPKQ